MTDKKKPHTKEELISQYKQLGYPEEYFPRFESCYQRLYSAFYEDMKDFEEEDFEEGESIGGEALSFAAKYLDKFIVQINQSHGIEWAHEIADSIESSEERIINEAYECVKSQNEVLANKELLIHCKSLGEDELFERHYLYLFEIGEGWNHPRKTAKEYSTIYKQQIEAGKSEIYAHHYADLMSGDQWAQDYCEKYAYTYDKALSEGKDKAYAEIFAEKYGRGFVDNGEREEKDIPEFWEERIFAYMNGWEYARQNNLSNEFIKIYENVYLNTIYADEPEKNPWNRLEAYILEKALERYEEIIK